MTGLLMFLVFIFVIIGIIYLIRLPIIIAKKRGVAGADLATISILSWLGLVIGITWVVALVLSLVYNTSVQIKQEKRFISADELEKLYTLKQQGVLSQAEFDSYKQRVLKNE